MFGMELPNGQKVELSQRSKIIAGAIVVLLVVLGVLDRFVLIGKFVDSTTVAFRQPVPSTLTIKEIGKRHLVEIDTSRLVSRRGKKDKRMRLAVHFEDPNGTEIYDSSEWIRRKKRYFSFTPSVAGEYKIRIKRTGGLIDDQRGTAFVMVRVGDKRFPGLQRALTPKKCA